MRCALLRTSLNVSVGETVAFEITNSGVLPHEFFVGTPAE